MAGTNGTAKRGNLSPVSEGMRVPPNDLDAERSVIGAVLVSEDALGRVAEIVRPEDFYSETHRIVYAAALAVSSRGVAADQITVSEELQRVEEFDRIGGRAFVFSLVESVPMVSNASRWAEIVRSKAILRNLIDAGSRIAEDAFREPDDVGEALDGAEQIVYQIAQGGAAGSREQRGASSMADLTQAAMEELQRRYESGVSPGLSTGFSDLDRMTTGSHPGELVILAARPAMGKTSMLLSLVEAGAKDPDGAALVFSLEMSKEQLTNRAISHASGIQTTSITDPTKLRSDDWPRLISAAGRVGDRPILIDDAAEQTVTKMRNRIRREVSKLNAQGRHLSIIAVDYLQLMVGDRSRNADNRTTEVGEISRGLKVIAREFEVPVIALSQLSRACEMRHDKRPKLSDLRESGGIEQDSDKVIFLYRDEYYEDSTEEKGIAEVIVAKHRNGPTGTVKLAFVERLAQFASLARQDVT